MPAPHVARAVDALTRTYAARAPIDIADAAAHAAYLAVRAPATYAAVASALAHVPTALLGGCTSMLDLGAGPGTASWAVLAADVPVAHVTHVDHSRALLALGARLTPAAVSGPEVTLTQHVAPLTAADGWPSADLVVVSYALAELPPGDIARVITAAWQATRRLLLVVEPGTPDGTGRVLDARSILLSGGGQVVAPCPHALECPLRASVSDWCHFSVRLPRSRRHRQLKGGSLGYEDEKFAYVALTRAAGPQGEGGAGLARGVGVELQLDARIVRHPRVDPGRITLELCERDGEARRRVVTRRDASWRAARKAGWGDLWPLD